MNAWKWILIAFLLGALAGAGGLAIFDWLQFEPPEFAEYQPAEGAGWTELQAETGRLLERIGEQRGEIERLEAELAARTAPVSETEENSVPSEEDEREARRAAFQARMEERMNRQVDELVTNYGMSDAQKQLLVEVFEQQRDYFRARRAGEDVPPFSFDAALENIMTDDQFDQYVEDTQSEIYDRAELLATTQLTRMSQQMDLLPEQQDLIYDAVHYTAQEAMIARQAGEDFDMRRTLNNRLTTILTEEQMEVYQASDIDRMTGGRRRPPGP